MSEIFGSFRVDEDYTWQDNILNITRRITDEINDARLSNITAHFDVDLSEIREFLNAKRREHLAPMTNADKLRSMTDEELADWVWGAETAGRAYGPRGKKAWLDWLRKESE
jgi:hypothetical protein